MSDLARFLATLLFWGAFAIVEGAIAAFLGSALGGKGEGAAMALIALMIVALVVGAVIAVPRYNAMMKRMEQR